MPLTAKQERFVVAYLETGNASEAYRRAYDAGAMKPASVNRMAHELLLNLKIASRIAELRQPVVDAAQVTLSTHLARLDELSRWAQQEGNAPAAVAAEVKRGEAGGLYVQRKQIEMTRSERDLTDAELEAIARRGGASGEGASDEADGEGQPRQVH